MWQKHKSKIIATLLIIAVLIAAFLSGGELDKENDSEKPPENQITQNVQTEQSSGQDVKQDEPLPQLPSEAVQKKEPPQSDSESVVTEELQPPENETESESDNKSDGETVKEPDPNPETEAEGDSNTSGMEINPETGKDQYHTDPVPEGMPTPVEPQDTTVTETVWTCTISISCATILDNWDDLDEEKVDIVPEDGWILEPVTVSFHEGESVFDVLLRVCREQNIHMEFMDTPMYNSAYIEGIHNLYEFDCGPLSGWMYKVNEWFPNYGCSRYALKDGDIVCWVYTCDLGADVGDNSMRG